MIYPMKSTAKSVLGLAMIGALFVWELVLVLWRTFVLQQSAAEQLANMEAAEE